MASVHPSAPPLNEISTPIYAEQAAVAAAASPKKKKAVKKAEEAAATEQDAVAAKERVPFKPEGLWLSAEDVPEELVKELGSTRVTVYNRAVGLGNVSDQDLPLNNVVEPLRAQVCSLGTKCPHVLTYNRSSCDASGLILPLEESKTRPPPNSF